MDPQKSPLVSCLCVTRNKVEKLKRVIRCFLAQSYPNKELLILYEDNDPATQQFAETFTNDLVRFVKVSATPKLSLGELRNISVEECRGEYFCQWDDDDWYHIDRLSSQMSALVSNLQPVSFLMNWLIYDEVNHQAYFSFLRMWEGSIICKKSVIGGDLKYPSMTKAEDSVFVEQLQQTTRIYPLVNPTLYIYVFHGNNTWDVGHFQDLVQSCQLLPPSVADLIKDILNERYDVAEASSRLDSANVIGQLDYFHSIKKDHRRAHERFLAKKKITIARENILQRIDALEKELAEQVNTFDYEEVFDTHWQTLGEELFDQYLTAVKADNKVSGN
jgi:glycosyltransferase involved in cell wall biosynthesis